VPETPLFSVIVPTHNRPDYLAHALDSVRQQTVVDFECVVVNDGGMPVRLPDDARFRLVSKENGGFASALNAGLQEAKGTYVAILDDDDAFTPNRLELGIRGMAEAPLSFCWRAKIDTGIGGYDRLLKGWVHDEILDRGTPLLGQTTVLRERMPRFNDDLTHGSDVDWLLRATEEMKVSTIPEIGFLFRQSHPGRKSHKLRERLAARELFYEVHKEYFKTHRKAASRYHSRLGLYLAQMGEHRRALQHLWRAVVLRPTPRMLFRWARELLPRAAKRDSQAAG
jgi:glycosyltransferase involved in cell wall biosynthesis